MDFIHITIDDAKETKIDENNGDTVKDNIDTTPGMTSLQGQNIKLHFRQLAEKNLLLQPKI